MLVWYLHDAPNPFQEQNPPPIACFYNAETSKNDSFCEDLAVFASFVTVDMTNHHAPEDQPARMFSQ